MADSSVYPGAIDAVADLPVDVTNDTDNGDGTPRTGTVGWAAALFNRYSSAIRHTELELGTDPSGTFTDVAGRLNARLTCRKTADQTIANATLANLTDLTLPIATTGLDYYFKFVVTMSAAALASGWRVAVTCPALTGYICAQVFGPISSTAEATTAAPVLANYHQWGVISSSGDVVVGYQTPANNQIIPITIEGIVSNPSATGNLQVQAASEAAATTIWRRGSWGEVYIN